MRIDRAELTISAERADAEPARTLLAAMAAELDTLYARLEGNLDSLPATPEQMWAPTGSFLVIRRDGDAVSCGGIKRLGEGLAEIKRMYVVPGLRGRGLARVLLGALEDEAVRLGYPRVRLDTGADQPEARSLYERAGYEPIPDYNGNPYAAYWFEKRLGGEAEAKAAGSDQP